MNASTKSGMCPSHVFTYNGRSERLEVDSVDVERGEITVRSTAAPSDHRSVARRSVARIITERIAWRWVVYDNEPETGSVTPVPDIAAWLEAVWAQASGR